MSLARMLKAGIEGGLVASGLPGARIRNRASGTVILSYHNVVPTGETPVGDTSLHIPQARFAEHLDRLRATHDVVALSDLRFGDPLPARPRAVVTFDDAYRGAITAGFAELSQRGLPATVFVPPGLLGNDGFWWDRLADRATGLDPAVRVHALDTLGGHGPATIAWAESEGLSVGDLPAHARPASDAELFAAVRSGRFSLGSHTWSHVNLAAVPLEEARTEIERGHAWLATLDPDIATDDWLAYPYGLESGAVVSFAAEIVGHAVRVEGGAAEVRGAWVADRHRLPRINVPAGLSGAGLVLRLAGLR